MRLLVSFIFLAFVSFSTFQPPSGTGIQTFTPLHLYFMDTVANGCNDTRAGTTTATAWCNPDNNGHVGIVCGDVIVANAGAYAPGGSGQMQITHSAGICPSTTGGIDGGGGIMAAAVVCATLHGCTVTTNVGGNGFNVHANFWSVQKWKVTNTNTGGTAFANDGTAGTLFHHISFINNLAFNSGSGFSFSPQGANGNPDYGASVGNIAQNAAFNSVCTSAFNMVTPINLDTNAGTHFYYAYNYGIANGGGTTCGPPDSDRNGLIIDSPDVSSYTGQFAVENNMIWNSGNFGYHIFSQAGSSVTPIIEMIHNTGYNNGISPPTAAQVSSEFDSGANLFTVTLQNNIGRTGVSGVGSVKDYAFTTGTATPNQVVGGTGNENILFGSAGTCVASNCLQTTGIGLDSVASFGSAALLGTNFYVDPAFTNTTDLTTNWLGVPSCGAFENNTQCMGYNAFTSTLTSNTPISDLTPTCAQCSGKGFQLPSLTCNTNALFPAYLKGLVYLHAVSGFTNGTVIQQKQGLAQVPCGL